MRLRRDVKGQRVAKLNVRSFNFLQLYTLKVLAFPPHQARASSTKLRRSDRARIAYRDSSFVSVSAAFVCRKFWQSLCVPRSRVLARHRVARVRRVRAFTLSSPQSRAPEPG